jgi:hypothetical protein
LGAGGASAGKRGRNDRQCDCSIDPHSPVLPSARGPGTQINRRNGVASGSAAGRCGRSRRYRQNKNIHIIQPVI